MDLVDGPKERDILVPTQNVHLVVDPKSALFVSGSVLDYSEDLQQGGFNDEHRHAVADRPRKLRRLELLGRQIARLSRRRCPISLQRQRRSRFEIAAARQGSSYYSRDECLKVRFNPSGMFFPSIQINWLEPQNRAFRADTL